MQERKARKFLEELCLINETVPIIVEGFRDEKALRALGVRGDIVKVHTGRSIQQFCDEYSARYSEAVILTDWDLRGNQIFGLLTRYLEVDWERYRHFRDRLQLLAGSAFKEVESILTWRDHLSLADQP